MWAASMGWEYSLARGASESIWKGKILKQIVLWLLFLVWFGFGMKGRGEVKLPVYLLKYLQMSYEPAEVIRKHAPSQRL